MQEPYKVTGKHLRLAASCLDAAVRGRSSGIATMSAVEYH